MPNNVIACIYKKYCHTADTDFQILHYAARLTKISLGILKLNSRWHCLTIFMSLVLKSFMKKRLTTKSSELMTVLVRGHASSPYSITDIHFLGVIPILLLFPHLFPRCVRSNFSTKLASDGVQDGGLSEVHTLWVFSSFIIIIHARRYCDQVCLFVGWFVR